MFYLILTKHLNFKIVPLGPNIRFRAPTLAKKNGMSRNVVLL